jgi:cytochrome c5
MGDMQTWAPRIEKGEDVLIESTIQGIPPGMPPRGLCMQCSDEELAATVRFMLNASR